MGVDTSTGEIFFLKNQTQNVVEKLLPDRPFHKAGLELVFLSHFLHDFWRNISPAIFY